MRPGFFTVARQLVCKREGEASQHRADQALCSAISQDSAERPTSRRAATAEPGAEGTTGPLGSILRRASATGRGCELRVSCCDGGYRDGHARLRPVATVHRAAAGRVIWNCVHHAKKHLRGPMMV